MKAYHGILPVFDDPNLVSDGGLVALGALARKAGFHELVARSSTLSVPAVAAKAWTVVAGMASGADNIDGLDRLRSGGTQKVLAGIKAPSTIGTFLRSVTNGGHVEQFAKVNRLLLGNLTDSVPGLVSDDQVVFVDIDDTIKEVHGHQKGGAGFGYTKVRGLNAMMSTISTPRSAPVIAEFSLRKGSTSSGKGAARQIARALATTSKLLGANQRPLVRADSAFCTAANVHAATRAGAWYSLTVKAWNTVTKAIAEIPEEAWVPINYPNAVWDDESKQWVSEAEVAEIPFTAFSSKPAGQQVKTRLVVRRVARKPDNERQSQLFSDHRHHAFITNSPFNAVQADQMHRGHAVIEQVFSELKAGPLANLPSGKFHANALWLALAVIAFNLVRAAAHAAGMPKARFATAKNQIIKVPARIASTARRIVMHLPTHWPWARAWERLWEAVT